MKIIEEGGVLFKENAHRQFQKLTQARQQKVMTVALQVKERIERGESILLFEKGIWSVYVCREEAANVGIVFLLIGSASWIVQQVFA